MLIERDAAERAAAELLAALGANLAEDHLRDTPRRMVDDAYAELLTPEPFRATTFRTTRATTSSCWSARSSSTPSACTTCS